MTFFHNKMFLEGIAIGGICGIVIGSIIAFTLGKNSVGALRRFIDERSSWRNQPDYRYLY